VVTEEQGEFQSNFTIVEFIIKERLANAADHVLSTVYDVLFNSLTEWILRSPSGQSQQTCSLGAIIY
jgi:hypothetical protein